MIHNEVVPLLEEMIREMLTGTQFEDHCCSAKALYSFGRLVLSYISCSRDSQDLPVQFFPRPTIYCGVVKVKEEDNLDSIDGLHQKIETNLAIHDTDHDPDRITF